VNHPPQLIDVVKPKLIGSTVTQADLPPQLKEKVTLRSEAIDIRSLMLGLAKQTALNITLDPDVTGQVSAYFTDIAVIDALTQIADQLGAEVEVHGNVISVHKPHNDVRMYRLHYLRSPRSGITLLSIQDRSGSNSGVAGGGFSTTVGQSQVAAVPTAIPGQVGGANAQTTGPLGVAPPQTQGRGDSSETLVSTFASNFWEDLGEQLKTFIFEGDSPKDLLEKNNHSAGLVVSDSSGRKLIIDSMAGNIVVQARKSVLDDIGIYLKAVEETVNRQVVIDVRILEVSLQDQTIFGIDSVGGPLLPSTVLGSLGKTFGGTVNTASVTTPLGFTSINNATAGLGFASTPTYGAVGGANTGAIGSGVALQPVTSNPSPYGIQLFGTTGTGSGAQPFQLLIQALGQLTDLRVVSSPRLTALHNQKALLKVVREHVFYLEQTGTTSLSATGVAVQASNTFYPVVVPEGVVMEITPLVDDNGEVTLEIHPSFSSIADIVPAPQGQGSQPEVDRREFMTTVHVKGEETVMLGGLVSETSSRSEAGIPLLKDIPFLGGLFRNTNETTTKSEIILLLTPRVQGPTVTRDFVNGLRTLSDREPIPVMAPRAEPTTPRPAPAPPATEAPAQPAPTPEAPKGN
jgi:MSHA biogenesis protein MshL